MQFPYDRGHIYTRFSHKTSLTSPLFIEVPVPSQESGWSCMCVLEVIGIVPFYVFSIGFWNCSDSMVFCAFQFIQI